MSLHLPYITEPLPPEEATYMEISSSMIQFDWTLLVEMERMIDVIFRDYLIMDVGDYITVTYYIFCHLITLFFRMNGIATKKFNQILNVR